MKLNLGCGPARLEGYCNIDAREGVSPDMVADLKSLVFDNQTIEEIYCSHTLEHLSFEEAGKILKRFYLWLTPGGLLYIAVPDIKRICGLIIQGKDDIVLWNNIWGAVDDTPYMIHRWGYTESTLTRILEDAGFEVAGRFEGRDTDSRQDISLNLIGRKNG